MIFPDHIDLETYRRLYPEIAARLQSARTAPMPGELAFLQRAAEGELPPGNVGPANLCFLAAVTSATGATRLLEIGTASGTSTALLATIAASTLAERGEALPPVLIDSIDKKSACLFDAARPIGYMVRERAPELASRVRIHTELDSFHAAKVAAAGSVDLAFIDGNHQHPWPLIDALNLLPLLRPGGWLVLHDIDLPAVAERMQIEPRHGATWLFEGWPGAKLASGNIGIVAVPEDRSAVLPFFQELAARPFEVAESGWKRYRRMLEQAFTAASLA